MSLDAKVFCDCYERGLLRTEPPGGMVLEVCPDGSLNRISPQASLEQDIAFDKWRLDSACVHQNGILLHHRLGNIGLIALLRDEFSTEPERLPILLSKVVYDGMHAGDFVPVAILPSLGEEIRHLKTFPCRQKKSATFIANFADQMLELIEAATAVQKPIVF